MGKTKEEVGVVYSEEIKYAIERIGLLSSDMSNPSYFSLYNDIISVVYDHINEVEISQSTFRLVWQMLNRIVAAGNFVWFKQYWSWAVQYEMFMYNGIKRSESHRRFFFFHVMVGAMLCFNKRYEWLSFTLFYTNKKPESFGLIPNTYQEIMDVAEEIYNMSEQPFYFESNFQLDGVAVGARNDSIIVGAAYEYLALLFVRLWSLDYNVSNAEPKEIPYIDMNNIERNEDMAIISGMLRVKVKGWYDKKRIEEVELRELPEIKDVIDLIDIFIRQVDKQNKYIYENAEPNANKLEKLKEDLRSSALRASSYFPGQSDSRLEMNKAKADKHLLSFDYRIEKSVLIKERSISYTNLPDVLIKNLLNQAIGYYENVFLNNNAKHTYIVRYDDIGCAIEKLCLSDDYVILSFGEYISDKFNIYIPIVNVGSRMSCILIMKKNQLPFVEYVAERQSEDNMEEISDDGIHLYSNVSHLSSKTKLKLRQCIVIYSPKNTLKFIRLNVDHFSLLDDFDLNKIEPIDF